jgi:hypothetical protein
MRLDRRRDATRNLNGIIHGEPTHATFALFVEAFLMMTCESMRNRQNDEAEKHVQKAINLGRSCAKAWEVKRVLAEKRKEYRVAADASGESWVLSGQSALGVGFRLALNYKKAEGTAEAVKVSRVILAKHPNYPKLREVIFWPWCAVLRP